MGSMSFNIDIIMVVVFLTVTLIVGMVYGRGVRTIEDYALGGRNFSTATLSSTLIATWIGGGFFAISISQTYQDGLFYVVAGTGDIIALLIVSYLFAKRMQEFLGSVSLAEVMGVLYGRYVRVISALACIAIAVGAIALQLKVISSIFNYFFSLESIYALLASSFILIVYSTFGGIRSVTFTDIIQFLTFGAFVPIFALFVWNVLGDHEMIIQNLSATPMFDYRELANYNNPKFLPYLTIFTYSALFTSLDPSLFQRALLAKDPKQIKQSFLIASFVGIFVLFVSCSIGAIIYGYNPGLNPNNLVVYIIDNYSYPGLKGFVLVGILAITMSTADSWINISSVIFANDFCKPLNIKPNMNRLFLSRYFSVFIGLFSIVLAITADNLLELLLLIGNFFCPIVGPILLLGIFGMRSTPKAALSAIFAGVVGTITWRIFWQDSTGLDSVLPGSFANFVVFLAVHFSDSKERVKLKEWRLIPQMKNFVIPRLDKKAVVLFSEVIRKTMNFNLLAYCNKTASKHENTYVHFGVFAGLSVLCTTVLLDQNLYQQNIVFVNVAQIITLALSTILVTNSLWSERLKNKYLALVWYVTIFISLIMTSCFLLLINSFSSTSLMIFTINLLVISYLLKWHETIFMFFSGIAISYIISYYYFDVSLVYLKLYDWKFNIVYMMLMLTSSFIFFLKPQQEHYAATEAKVGTLETEVTDLSKKVEHYGMRVVDQQREIDRLGATAQKILNNVNHELRLPVGNVMNFVELLKNGLGKFNENQLKDLAGEVYKNTNRLSTMILNMLDLATLDVKKMSLQKQMINFSEMVENRVHECRRIYLDGKPIDFELAIEPEILISVDPNYIRQAIDNLVVNSINFSNKGVISISVERQDKSVILSVDDQGIGIPKEDVYDIFTPFKMGSNTESKAQGRGVGLALCKSVAEAHGGSIMAKSKARGAVFTMMLPV
jgi:Na+/proline symporter/signal transduction histidine kinase